MVDKAPDAFRTISEVAGDLDLLQHVLRFWETRFQQIKPLKRGGGRRYYRPDDVDLLKGIRQLLYGEGYTIRGVQRILKEEGARFVQALGRGEESVSAPRQEAKEEADSMRRLGCLDIEQAALIDEWYWSVCREILAGLRAARLEDVTTFARYLGGSPANTAVGCARLGLRPAMLTRVGDEQNGNFVRETLAREGVDVTHVTTDPARLTALVFLSVRAADNFPLLFYRDRCADMGLAPEHVDADFVAQCGARFTPEEVGRIDAVILGAYRWQYIVSGVQDPRFSGLLGEMITAEQGRRIGAALAPIVSLQ